MLHRLAAYTRKSGNESPPKRRATADSHASALAHSIPPRSPTSHIGFCNPASISGTSRADSQFASWALGSAMHWDANHLDACKMMMVARGGCQVAADVSSAALETWADLKANKYAEACDTGLDGEKGYCITNAGRAAYKVEIRRPSKR